MVFVFSVLGLDKVYAGLHFCYAYYKRNKKPKPLFYPLDISYSKFTFI